MSRKRDRTNSFLDNTDKLDNDENIFDYTFYLDLVKKKRDKVTNDFNKYKSLAKNHFFDNNEILRLEDNYYIKQSSYQNIKLSPDCFTANGELVDLYVSSKNKDEITLNNLSETYNNYIQIIMNILNLERCIVYVYNFVEFDNTREFRKSKIPIIKNKYGIIMNKCKDIYWAIGHTRKIIINRNKKFNLRSISTINDKIFSINVDKFITPKIKKIKKDKYIGEDWIAASKTRNSALNDHCMDYFRAYNIKDIDDKPTKMTFSFEPSSKVERIDRELVDAKSFIDFLLINGNKFEDDIVKKIINKFPNKFVKICESYESRNMKYFQDTLKEMRKNTPIIHQAVLYNFKYKVFGSADLLVRSDYLNKLVNTNIISNSDMKIQAPILSGRFHYRVIDIKCSKMHLNTDNQTVRNNNNVKPFKTQIAIYNLALGEMQGYLPDKSYILGNGWVMNKIENKRKIKSSSENPFNKLGEINFSERDNKYYDTALDGVKWINELNTKTEWNHDPPNDPRIYPNMSNSYDGFYHKVKKQIANKYGEITSVWNCGVQNRKIAFDKNIKSWKDKKCNSKTLGITGKKKSKMINNILKFNQDRSKLINIDKIDHNNNNWRSDNLIFYVDFETIGTSLLKRNKKTDIGVSGDFIFMVGIGWKEPNNESWNYNCYYTKNVSLSEEKRILIQMNDKIKELEQKFKCSANVIHWSYAEPNFYNRAFNRYGNILDRIKWFDLLTFFKDNNILVLDCLNYSLKTIATNMCKHNLIKTSWGNEITNGVDAMFHSWQIYVKNEDVETSKIYKDIVKYNEIDCKTMFEIHNYLIKNH